MNVVEAIQQAGDKWFRPIAWRGGGVAYCVRDANTYRVPTGRGGEPGMTADVFSLTGEWEVIPPAVVIEERHAAR